MPNTDAPDKSYYTFANHWHQDLLLAKEKIIALYRYVSLSLLGLLTLALVGLTALISHEKVQPFLALVDKRTGEVTTPMQLNSQVLSHHWNMVRHFVTSYVIDRESYNFLNLNVPYQTIVTMSSPNVIKQIDKEIRPELNPESPITVLAAHHYRTVNIHSIAKLSNSNHLLDLRLTTRTISSDTHKVEKEEAWRVVMRWEIVNKKRSLSEWDKNPLGFTVTLYDKQPIS